MEVDDWMNGKRNNGGVGIEWSKLKKKLKCDYPFFVLVRV